ncbi:MAG: alpha/beta fold hydrolase [Pseudomonadota bacterium]
MRPARGLVGVAGLAGLMVLALMPNTATAGATEVTVQLDQAGTPIIGTLTLPAGAPAPAVLLLHGFTGTRDETPVRGTGEGVLERTARHLADAGFASLRIDFRGSGDSGMDWADTTFSTQIADATLALAWLADDPRVDGRDLSLLGWSQGGLVAAHAARGRADLAALILWAPVVDPMDTYARIFGQTRLAEALTLPADRLVASPPGGPPALRAAFFHELPETSMAAALAQYPGPTLVIMALRDGLIGPQPEIGARLLRSHSGPSALEVLDTDHAWGAAEGPEMLDTRLLPATLAWLRDRHAAVPQPSQTPRSQTQP